MVRKISWTSIIIPGLLLVTLSETALADKLKVGDRAKVGPQTGTVTIVYGNTTCMQLDDGGTACATCQGKTCYGKVQEGRTQQKVTIIKLPTSAGAARDPAGGLPTGQRTITPATTTVNPTLTNPGPLGSSGGTGSAATAGSKAKLPASGTTTQGR
jgi:hypothetical protein